MNKNIEILESALDRINNNESVIYFLVYDTKGNARASLKHIYDIALTLKDNNFNVKLLTEDKTYRGVSGWLDVSYDSLEVLSIKEDSVQIKLDDIVVIPEYYSNVLQQLSNLRCVKVMLVQQLQYIYETLPIGSRWSDYGFDKVITTTERAKKYILEYFPQSLVHIIPPIIGDNFKPSDKPLKPYIAINCRDRMTHKKLISEFYLKYPQLRWITFRDMVQLTYDDFSENLKECMVSLWVDDDSTFGTFPLESMKCGVPVVGKIPDLEPDWMAENGMWTYDSEKLVDILGTYILAWLEGVELKDEVKDKTKETLLPYNKDLTKENINSIFTSFKNKRIESIQNALEKLKQEETV
jgi:glycosyltransferase involved in cell wall biosynthesis